MGGGDKDHTHGTSDLDSVRQVVKLGGHWLSPLFLRSIRSITGGGLNVNPLFRGILKGFPDIINIASVGKGHILCDARLHFPTMEHNNFNSPIVNVRLKRIEDDISAVIIENIVNIELANWVAIHLVSPCSI